MKLKSFTVALISVFTLSFTANAETVIPSGTAVGIVINSDGLIVTDVDNVTTAYGEFVDAAKRAGIKSGDRIISADDTPLESIDSFSEYVNNHSENIKLTINRNDSIFTINISPTRTKDGFKIGAVVRDSVAGIGTISFVEPKSKTFYGLGHAVSDIDTNSIIPVKYGSILSCQLTSATKGKIGFPGELNGIFSTHELGNVTSNNESGIMGTITNLPVGSPIPTSKFNEIKSGAASILCDIDGGGVKSYSATVRKKLNPDTPKNMVIEITDDSLIEKTGGIVQGMSGAPIIQNGKLIGAITHVFVNNPRKGYAISAENMISR